MKKYGVTIREVDSLGGGIAKVNIATGLITIARDRFYQFDPEIRRFVLLHEIGHYILQSDNEFLVDQWALKEYMRTGGSSRKAVYALTKVLPFSNPEHLQRAKAQLDRVRHYDFHYNGNFKALTNPTHNVFIRNYTLRKGF